MDEQDNIGTFFMWGFCHPAGVDFRWATFPVVALRLPPANGFEAAGFIQPRGRFLFLTSGASRGRCPRLRRSRLSGDSPHNGEQRCFTGLSHIAPLGHSRARVPPLSIWTFFVRYSTFPLIRFPCPFVAPPLCGASWLGILCV